MIVKKYQVNVPQVLLKIVMEFVVLKVGMVTDFVMMEVMNITEMLYSLIVLN